MNGDYPPLAEPREVGIPTVEHPGPVDQLMQQKAQLEKRLAQVNAALDALEKNPEVSMILQLVGRALRY